MDTWSGAEEEAVSPACPICHGAGFVYSNVPVGHADFGKALPCRCTQEESEKERQSRLERYSNLGVLSRLTFDNLVEQGRSGDIGNQELFKAAYQAARAFAAEAKGWLVLVGSSGCGKTHLAVAIANERLKHLQPVFFITTPDLLDHLRATFSPESEIPYDEFFNRVRNAPLLILDDLGTQTGTPWAREKLDQLLTHRFNCQLPTVIVTITPVEELEERTRTRLADPELCRIYVVEERKPPALGYRGDLELKLLKSMTFDNFDWKRVNLLPEQSQNLEQAFRLALEFAKSPDGWLVLQGETGCGKTHLAAAIANYRLQGGKPALLVVVPDLLDRLRATFGPESRLSYQLLESVKNAPLLILDDFGEQSATPWAQEKLYQIINYRYNDRLATVVTTRHSLDEIEGPVSSRLVDPKISLVWNIIAPDYRGDLRSSRKSSRGGWKGRSG